VKGETHALESIGFDPERVDRMEVCFQDVMHMFEESGGDGRVMTATLLVFERRTRGYQDRACGLPW
jgi:hypothetical protein